MLIRKEKFLALANSRYLKELSTALLFILLIILLISHNTQDMAERMFWLDEVTTLHGATLPFWQIPRFSVSVQMQPPFFYWLGYFFEKIGNDPFTLRTAPLSLYILMIGFVFFYLRELQFTARIFLCLILILTPFSTYLATEFRPYSFAALSIIISSIFLYRALNRPYSWSAVILYGFSALLLQYTLSLNSFVFGIQILFISTASAFDLYNKGFSKTFENNKPILMVSLLLCCLYVVFLYLVSGVSINQGYLPGLFVMNDYIGSLKTNFKILLDSIVLLDSWLRYLTISLFFVGFIVGIRLNKWLILYLMIILVGQFLFSTYMTFSRISWFSQRYIVASYVTYAMICALGADYLFRVIGKKAALLLVIAILISSLYTSINNFIKSLQTVKFNPTIAVVESLRCNNRMTMLLGNPGYITFVPEYAFRHDPLIIAPKHDKNIYKIISQAASKKYCFIFQKMKKISSDEKLFIVLSSLPGYQSQMHLTTRGSHVPATAWTFYPK